MAVNRQTIMPKELPAPPTAHQIQNVLCFFNKFNVPPRYSNILTNSILKANLPPDLPAQFCDNTKIKQEWIQSKEQFQFNLYNLLKKRKNRKKYICRRVELRLVNNLMYNPNLEEECDKLGVGAIACCKCVNQNCQKKYCACLKKHRFCNSLCQCLQCHNQSSSENRRANRKIKKRVAQLKGPAIKWISRYRKLEQKYRNLYANYC